MVEDLKRAWDNKDWKEVAELAHRAKGSCGAIGATSAQKLCALLQKQMETQTNIQNSHYLEETIKKTLNAVLLDAQKYRESQKK